MPFYSSGLCSLGRNCSFDSRTLRVQPTQHCTHNRRPTGGCAGAGTFPSPVWTNMLVWWMQHFLATPNCFVTFRRTATAAAAAAGRLIRKIDETIGACGIYMCRGLRGEEKDTPLPSPMSWFDCRPTNPMDISFTVSIFIEGEYYSHVHRKKRVSRNS